MYVYLCNIKTRHLPGTAGELKRSLPCTLAPRSPALPVGLRGAVVTNDWCVFLIFSVFDPNQCQTWQFLSRNDTKRPKGYKKWQKSYLNMRHSPVYMYPRERIPLRYSDLPPRGLYFTRNIHYSEKSVGYHIKMLKYMYTSYNDISSYHLNKRVLFPR